MRPAESLTMDCGITWPRWCRVAIDYTTRFLNFAKLIRQWIIYHKSWHFQTFRFYIEIHALHQIGEQICESQSGGKSAAIKINVIGGTYRIKCKVTLALVTSITSAFMVTVIWFGPNNPHVVGIIFTSHYKCVFWSCQVFLHKLKPWALISRDWLCAVNSTI